VSINKIGVALIAAAAAGGVSDDLCK
jgi:hypothetical protein